LASVCGIAIRLPATIVKAPRSAAAPAQSDAVGPASSTKTRSSTANPAAFGATESHATKGVAAAS
jgi:hypothetical protein